MLTDPDPHLFQNLWQNQSTEAKPVDIEKIHKRAAYFQRMVRWRNVREYAVAAFVVFQFAQRMLATGSPLLRVGDSLVILGVGFICWQLHRRGSAEACPPGASSAAYFRFYRAQLLRQRTALRSVLVWYIGPLAPGLLTIFAARMLAHPDALKPAVGLAVISLLGLIVWYVNQLAADGMDKQIAEVDRVLQDYE